MTSLPWLWIYSGLALMLLELGVPGFILCFFGLAALTVGALGFIFGEAFGLTAQVAAFSVLSILYIFLLRRWLKSIFTGRTAVTKTDFEHDYIGRVGVVTEAINPPLAGRVTIGETAWTAVSAAPLAVGTSVKVTRQDNLTFVVTAVA